MRERLVSAIIIAVLALGALMLSGIGLLLFFGTAMLLAGYEFYSMARQGGYHPAWVPALIIIAGLFIDASLRLNLTLGLLVLAVLVCPLWELRRHRMTSYAGVRSAPPRIAGSASSPTTSAPRVASESNPSSGFLLNWALTVLGVLYVGVLGAHLFYLNNLGKGTVVGTVNLFGLVLPLNVGIQLLGISLLATAFTDMLAYAAGWLWGRHSFYPDISPKKTLEGALGGIVGGSLVFAVLATILNIPLPFALMGGFGIALMGTIGDLVESLIKRNIGVKDSGTLVSGHGGVLDRLDSLFFALTFAYYYCTLVLGYR